MLKTCSRRIKSFALHIDAYQAYTRRNLGRDYCDLFNQVINDRLEEGNGVNKSMQLFCTVPLNLNRRRC